VRSFLTFQQDILHSYLGLAGLATMREPGLKSLDPTLCISVSACEHLESLPWRRGDASSQKRRGGKKPLDILAEDIATTFSAIDD